MRRSLRLAFLCQCALFLCLIQMLSPVRAVAQDLDDVVIRGRVLDQNGAIILGATVTALKTATNNERAAVTNEEGNYRIIELEPGTYTVRVSAIGFAVEEKKRTCDGGGAERATRFHFASRHARRRANNRYASGRAAR